MDGSTVQSSSSVDSFLRNYKLGKTLGIGSFGKVKIAEHTRTGHKVAVKILNRRKIRNMDMEEKVRREIKILRLFMHPHIIRLYEVIETPSDIYVVMEYVKSGELFDYIVEKGRLQEDEARNFFQQIISGVEYCHRNMVVHRDLKPENLLLDSKWNVKIADFGLSNIMRDGHFLKTSCGSPNYAAPEVISGKLYAGPEVDVWSCGVILYALLCGTLPFDDENIPNLFKKIKGGIYTLPSHLSAGARDLIPRMLIVDPMKRMTIPEIRLHPWFQAHLPRYLAVPPPDTMQQAKKIDEEILQEVVKMGFDRSNLIESLRNRVQNEGTVAYYLLLDNRHRVSTGYLGAEFQEFVEYGYNRNNSNEAVTSPVGQRFPGIMDYQQAGARQFPIERKWALGLQSRAHPREIMTEVLKALQELNVCWKKIGQYNMKCRWIPSVPGHHEGMGINSMHGSQFFGDDSTITENDGGFYCFNSENCVIVFSVTMDLSQSQSSNLSLGFIAHASPAGSAPSRAHIADDSITFQIDSRVKDQSHLVPPVPLQLMDKQTEENEKKGGESGDEEREVEEFRILGHSMCIKRRRDIDSTSSSSSSKCFRVTSSNEHMLGLESRKNAVRAWGNQGLQVADPDIFEIMEKEKQRQYKGIELIASENFVCKAVMEALGSHLTNKYSEGAPGARYYGGNQFIDEIETLCCKRALAAFGLDPENWGVNVQPYSCTSANFAVYTGLLLPGDRIMGLDTPSGGNTSHGYYLPNGRKVSGASIFFESLSYKVDPQTGYVDFDKLEERALDFRPKILICGGSSYPREWDYAKFRQIADKCGAVLLCDMAQISGLIAAKECASPFDYCDIVTSTTHKSLRGPRGGIIFYRKGSKPRKRGLLLNQGDGDKYDFEEKINFAVFPALQGGPHNNHIAALAIALKQVATPEYKTYMQQVKRNAQALAAALLRRNCRLVTGGTDNHMILWDLRNLGLTGKNFEKVCELCHITLNKVMVFDDNGSITPGGVRIGTPAMTSRGCIENDFETITDFLLKAAQITNSVQREHGKLAKAFLKGLENNKDVIELRTRVESFASLFAMPGFEV